MKSSVSSAASSGSTKSSRSANLSRSIMPLALKLLWRDWRGGELNILIAALLVAVTTVTGIGLFTDRISKSILDEAGTLLAADAQIAGSRPIPVTWHQEAEQQGLSTAFITSFQAMAFGAGNNVQLASIKAVSSQYPLKGEVEISDKPFGLVEKISHGPSSQEAWVSSRLLATLNLSVGDIIGVGDADLMISNVLISEPDNTSGGFGFSPRVLVHSDAIESTGAVQLGSRVRYAMLLAGDVETYKEHWLLAPSEHHRWRNVKDANESVTDTLERAESFLLLAGSLGVILAGVALALASKRYASRQLAHVALLKTLGLTPNNITRLYAGNLLILGFVVVLIGLFVGWFLHWSFLELFSNLLPRALVAASMKPLYIGFLTGVICLFAFAFPPVWVLRQTPPSKVLRSDVAGGTMSQSKTSLLGAAAVIGLVYFYSKSLTITLIMIVAGAVSIVGVSLIARLLIYVARYFASRLGTTWRLGLASLQRHGRQNSFQIMIFAISLMLLFVLTLLRTSLLTQWQQQLPQGTPNNFAFNIFADNKPRLEALLKKYDVPGTPFYPMMRGRLVVVEGEEIKQRLTRLNPEGDDFRRELNMTWSDTLAVDNAVVQGDWFSELDLQDSLISIEEEFARALDINIGDVLEFSFGGQPVSATVDNIRTVKWDSLSPNFYVIFNGPILEGVGAAYLTSFYLEEDQKPILVEILQNFPTISLIEVDAILEQIQTIVSQVTIAIEFILSLVLIAGFIVLVASVQATLDSRLQESAILRTIGAKASLVRGALAIEFITLGALAGFLAALGAETGLYFLQTELLNMPFSANLWLLLLGPVIGAVLIGGVGLISTQKVVKAPPMEVLRQL